MKSAASIYMNYRQAMRKADELDEIADELKKLADQELQNTLQMISANWKSTNATAYLAKGDKLGNNIQSTSVQIRNVASTVRSVAKRTYEAEMKAYRLAAARKYN